jgi:hypothetical protein
MGIQHIDIGRKTCVSENSLMGSSSSQSKKGELKLGEKGIQADISSKFMPLFYIIHTT